MSGAKRRKKPRKATEYFWRPFKLLWVALKKFDRDRGFFLASGITFNLLICLIPFLLLLLALVGTYLYGDQQVVRHIRRYLENAIPSLDPQIMENILAIIDDRQIVGLLGIAGLVWASTWVFSSLRIALNIIFQAKGRGVLRGTAVDLLMVLLVGCSLLISMVLTSLVTFLHGNQTFPLARFLDIGPIMKWTLKYAVPFLFTYGMFFLIYRIIPNKRIHMRSVLKAALFSSLLWEVVKQLFGWYVLHLSRFSLLYGSLGTVAIIFFWFYYSAAILLLGGEVAFVLERERETKGPVAEGSLQGA